VKGELLWQAIALALAVGGLWVFRLGFRALRVHWLIRNTPTSRVRSMAMGIAEVCRTLASRSRVLAPFSGRSCVWWDVEVQTLSSNSRSGTRSWRTVHRDSSGHPFFLRDETGVALVYPQGAECRVAWDVGEETGGLGVPDLYMEYMAGKHLGMRHLWAVGPMRFRERRLDEETHVYVLGHAYPRAASHAVSFDEEALEATGTDAVGATHVRTLDQETCAVVRRGPGDPVFLISTRPEREEQLMYGLKAAAGLVLGPLMTWFGTWCLVEVAKSGHLMK
jgi:hypothetical protein